MTNESYFECQFETLLDEVTKIVAHPSVQPFEIIEFVEKNLGIYDASVDEFEIFLEDFFDNFAGIRENLLMAAEKWRDSIVN